jgi:hypothetical protein
MTNRNPRQWCAVQSGQLRTPLVGTLWRIAFILLAEFNYWSYIGTAPLVLVRLIRTG